MPSTSPTRAAVMCAHAYKFQQVTWPAVKEVNHILENGHWQFKTVRLCFVFTCGLAVAPIHPLVDSVSHYKKSAVVNVREERPEWQILIIVVINPSLTDTSLPSCQSTSVTVNLRQPLHVSLRLLLSLSADVSLCLSTPIIVSQSRSLSVHVSFVSLRLSLSDALCQSFSCCVHLFSDQCPVVCNNQGEIVEGRCRCFQGFKGPDCSLREHMCVVPNCNGNGHCINGLCVCLQGFQGPDCGIGKLESAGETQTSMITFTPKPV